MSDKAKRKSNPRRRTLIRLIIGIVIIVALISAGYYALRPKGAQIVFISNRGTGIDQVWLADLDNPQYPEQLTFYEDGSIENLQTSDRNGVIVFDRSWQVADEREDETIVFYLSNNQHHVISTCDPQTNCVYEISPDGRWIGYLQFIQTGQIVTKSIYVYNIQTDERFLINEFTYEVEGSTIVLPPFTFFPYAQWIDNTELLAFRKGEEYVLYDVIQKRIIESISIEGVTSPVSFSPDRQYYYTYDDDYGWWIDGGIVEIRVSENIMQKPIVSDIPYYVSDWHPNSRHLLVENGNWYEEGYDDTEPTSIYLFDIRTQELTLLFTECDSAYELYWLEFNYNGTQILYDRYRSPDYQIHVYDITDAVNVKTPTIWSINRQWVNGGR